MGDSEADCPSTYSFCCGARPQSQDGPKLSMLQLQQADRGRNELQVETIDVPDQQNSAPRPIALARAMKTVLAHEECWDDWLNVVNPAATHAVYPCGGRDRKPAGGAEATHTPASSSLPVPASRGQGGYENAAKGPARGSNAEFFKPDQTVILFDWDDTLFPSNWLQQSEGFFKPVSETHAKMFLKLAESLESILKLAMGLGRVVIVTNSSEPWVSISVRTFMPFLEPLMKDIKVIYARTIYENAVAGTDSNAAVFGGALGAYKARLAMQADALAPQRWKEQAFKQEIGGFYTRYENQSWKNVISIGDSIYERDAAKNIILGLEGPSMHCRLKTAKFMENPPIEDLIAEIRVMHDALALIVQYDGNLDVEIDMDDLKHGLSLADKIVDPLVGDTVDHE